MEPVCLQRPGVARRLVPSTLAVPPAQNARTPTMKCAALLEIVPRLQWKQETVQIQVGTSITTVALRAHISAAYLPPLAMELG